MGAIFFIREESLRPEERSRKASHAAQNISTAPIFEEQESDVADLNGTGIRGRNKQNPVTATVGGEAATVEYADDQLEFVGLDQVVIRVPRSLVGRGLVDVVLTVDGKTANVVQVSFQ